MNARRVGGVTGASFGEAAARHYAAGWHAAVSIRIARQRATGSVELLEGEDIVSVIQQCVRLLAPHCSRICSGKVARH